MKRKELLIAVAAWLCAASSASPLQAAETDGRWAIGLNGGLYKLVLTDHSDAWTPGYLLGADVKYGLSPKFSLGVEGNWMQTKLADLSDKASDEGAGSSFSSIEDGPKQKAFTVGLLGEYGFSPDGNWSPHFDFGAGLYSWKWTDTDGNTLMSDDPALDNPDAGTGSVPDGDINGDPYELSDKELYLMGGLGLDYFFNDTVSLGLGVKFRYLTHLFTGFTDEKDIVGSDPGQLDLPSGIVEGVLGLTFHLGGGCPDMSVSASADKASGAVPMNVEYMSAVTGGCPPYTYAWDFGDGSNSTEQNPRHDYEAPGNYTASLTATDAKGNVAVGSFTVTAECAPLDANPTANPPSGDAPLTVQFSANATGGCAPLAYAWDFGDGQTSTEENPTHTYQTEGNMTPSLTVTDSKGTTFNKAGTPVVASSAFVPTPENPVILEGVNFETNKAVLLEGAGNILDRVAQSLIAHPEVKVEVGGHTDSDGKESYNMKLSQRRANTVRDYLIKMGVPAAQLTAKGYGESNPVADNKTVEGKAKNRRVELKAI